jgi:prepilin-type N-terminal cleavage/methylation domain-containing protein
MRFLQKLRSTNKNELALSSVGRACPEPVERVEGFTLVEVVIVIAIFVILSSITIFNYRDFDNSIKLKNQALGVALAIKTVQTKALSSRTLITATTAYAPYGIFFDTAAAYKDKANPFFDNTNGNRVFDGIESVVTADVFTLESGYAISDVCAGDGTTCTAVNPLNVSYLRPSIEAKICEGAAACAYKEARITIESPKGSTSTVYITNLGQIYVQ